MEKRDIISALHQLLKHQIAELSNEILSVNEEIGKETKSSAGDKFETSREMMNQERERLEERVAHLNRQINVLNGFQNSRLSTKVENGALVSTTSNVFFFGLAFGKLTLENQNIMVLSLNSPIGKAFVDKVEGDQISFMNQTHQIKTIC